MSKVKLNWPKIENQDKWFKRVIGKLSLEQTEHSSDAIPQSITSPEYKILEEYDWIRPKKL
jgi:hypothetical protein